MFQVSPPVYISHLEIDERFCLPNKDKVRLTKDDKGWGSASGRGRSWSRKGWETSYSIRWSWSAVPRNLSGQNCTEDVKIVDSHEMSNLSNVSSCVRIRLTKSRVRICGSSATTKYRWQQLLEDKQLFCSLERPSYTVKIEYQIVTRTKSRKCMRWLSHVKVAATTNNGT